MVQLGLGIVAASMLRAPRHAILEALSQTIGETCNFGVMTGSHVVYLDRVESAWPFGLRFEPGSRVPLHCTSMGKLFLSQLPAQNARCCCDRYPSTVIPKTPLPSSQTWKPRSIRSGQPRFQLIIKNFWLGLYAWPFRCARRAGSGSLHSPSPRHLHGCR
mgnify:CR=1 FL=1